MLRGTRRSLLTRPVSTTSTVPMALTTFGPFTGSDPNTASFSTTSFTPTANSLMVVILTAQEEAGATEPQGDFTVSGGSLTYTSRISVGNPDPWSCGMVFWTAPVGASPSSMTLTFDAGARDISPWIASVHCFTNYNATTPVGATASNGVFATDGAATLTLSGAPLASSYVLAFQVQSMDTPPMTDVTPGAGWTDICESYGGYLNLHGQTRNNSTSTSVDWADVRVGGTGFRAIAAALEIRSA